MKNDSPYPTFQDLNNAIVSEIYVTGAEAAEGAGYAAERIPAAVSQITLCLMTLDNGFSFVGVSHCADPSMYSAEVGRDAAREDAVAQAMPYLTFLAKEALHQQRLQKEAFTTLSTIFGRELEDEFA